MKIDPIRCGRCGQVHEDLEFRQLSGERRGTYWALCPSTGEPIILQIIQMTASTDSLGPMEIK